MLETLECGLDVSGAVAQALEQGHRILHGQSGARADGKMRGAQRITEQHHVFKAPALIPDGRELTPLGMVGDDRVPLQVLGEHPLTVRRGVFRRHGVKTHPVPGVVLNLDKKGASIGLVAVVVRAKNPLLRLSEGQGQAVERLGGAVPDEPVRTPVHGRAEFLLVFRTQPGKSPIGPHDQIGRAQVGQAVDLGFKFNAHAQALHEGMHQVEQLQSTDGGKTVACHWDVRVVVDDSDFWPVLKVRGQVIVQLLVIGLQEFQGPV